MRIHVLALALAVLVFRSAPAQRPPGVGSDPFRVVPTMKIEPPVQDGVGLRVVDADGAPRVGVDVVVLQTAAMRAEAARAIVRDPALNRFGADFDARMFAVAAALGTRHRTGEDGRVRVAVEGSARAFVALRRTMASVLLTERAKEREVEIVLDLPPAIEVLITDARGRPAPAVPLWIVDREDSFVFRMFEAPLETDREGRAWVPVPADGARKDLLAVIASRNLRRAALDPGAARIELQLPPCGQLRVYAAGAGLGAGRRVTGGRIQLPNAGFGWGGPYRVEAEEIGEDFVTFRWVGVGEPVEVQLEVDGKSAGPATVTSGPDLPGEMRIFRIDGIAAPLTRSLRLFAADREPLRAESVLWVLARPGSERRTTLRTGIDGELSLTVPPGEQVEGTELLLVHRDPDTGRGGARRWTLDELRAAPEAGLGDVVLEPEPVLAAGRVVSADGRPLAGIRVRAPADYGLPAADGGRSSSSTGVGDRYGWHGAVSDADGRFELRELNLRRGSVQLSIEAEGMWRIEGEDEFPRGETGVELVVAAAAGLAGSFAPFPAGLGFDGRIRAVAADGQVREIQRRGPSPEFELEGLPPGTYALEVALLNGEKPLLRIAGVEVLAGEICRDPRLQAIDWSAFMRPIRLSLVDPAGAVIDGASVTHRIDEENGWRGSRAQQIGGGVHAFWAGLDPAKVEIRHDEYRSLSLDGLNADREVRLEPRPRVRLEVRGLPDLPGYLPLVARFEPRLGGELALALPLLMMPFVGQRQAVGREPQIVRPDLDGAARLVLDLQIDWQVQARIREAGARIELRIPRDIDVQGGGAVQDFVFALSEDEVASLRDTAAAIQEILDRKC
jgi:hypothetical protein